MTAAHTPVFRRKNPSARPRKSLQWIPLPARKPIPRRLITKRRSRIVPERQDGLTGILRHMLDQLHLDHVDTGDLLLLGLLFFLFREDADEELLVALGLLLIL